MTHAQTRAFWRSINWSLRDIEIASDLNRSVTIIGHWRRKLGMPPSPTPHKWRNVPSSAHVTWDWSQNNSALARAHNFSRQYVLQLRQKLHMPKSHFHGQIRQRLAA